MAVGTTTTGTKALKQYWHDFFIEKTDPRKQFSKDTDFDGELIMHITAKTYRYTESDVEETTT